MPSGCGSDRASDSEAFVVAASCGTVPEVEGCVTSSDITYINPIGFFLPSSVAEEIEKLVLLCRITVKCRTSKCFFRFDVEPPLKEYLFPHKLHFAVSPPDSEKWSQTALLFEDLSIVTSA